MVKPSRENSRTETQGRPSHSAEEGCWKVVKKASLLRLSGTVDSFRLTRGQPQAFWRGHLGCVLCLRAHSPFMLTSQLMCVWSLILYYFLVEAAGPVSKLENISNNLINTFGSKPPTTFHPLPFLDLSGKFLHASDQLIIMSPPLT